MSFLSKRLLGGLLTIFVSSILVFGMVRMIPGDPAAVLLGRNYDPETARSLRLRYGLEGSIFTQYWEWVKSALTGDFGRSFLNDQPIADQLMPRIARTWELLLGGILVAMAIAIPSGILAARKRGTWVDNSVLSFTTILLSIPQFVVGIVLVFVFGVVLKMLPAGGWVDPAADFSGWLSSMVLPWATIGLTISAFTARVLRSSVVESMESHYVRTARSWGMAEGGIVAKHVLRNASIPTITVVGLEIGYLLGGAIVVEQVFAYPGMGQLIVNGLSNRDYPVIQASIMVFAVGFVLINLVVDLLIMLIDPRTRRA